MRDYKKFLNRILISALVLTFTFGNAFTALAATQGLRSRHLVNYTSLMEWPAGPEIDAEGAYLIELNTGSVVYAKNHNQQFFPASITKILTALVVIENSNLDEMVTFSHNAVYDIEDGGFSYIAEEGDKLSVKDCLYAMMLNSSNEAAYALAEHVAGSLKDFAVMMNEKAVEVGATNSNFVLPHGLTNSEHVTTPHDMALIMWAAIQNPVFLEIDSTVSYWAAATTSNPEGVYCEMRHSMMRNTDFHDDRVIAGKTGYISAAKNTLVTYAEQDDKELICVVMRVNGSEQACRDTKKLLDYGFKKFQIKDIPSGIDENVIKDKISAENGRNVTELGFPETIEMLLPQEASYPELTYTLDIEEASENENVLTGKLNFFFEEKCISEKDIIASLEPVETEPVEETEDILSGDFFDTEENDKNLFSIKKILIISGAAILIIIIIILINTAVRNSRRRKNRRQRIADRKRYRR